MKTKKTTAALNSFLLISLVLIGSTSNAAPTVPKPVIKDTRMYFGPCPSQNKDQIDGQKSAAVLGVGALIGGELIKVGINALAAGLANAAQSKTEYTYAASNLADSQTIGISDCLTIIEGSFALTPNQNEVIDDFQIYPGLEKNLTNIKTNLTANNIFLASVPTKYIEMRILHPDESVGGTSLTKGFYLSPLLFAFNKPLGRNSYGFHTGERDVVVSAAFSSNETTTKLPEVLKFKDVVAPAVYYFDPALIQSCSQKYSAAQTKAGLMPLCGGEQGSVWIQYPKGNGPYRFEISVAETRDASKFVKALSDALSEPEVKKAVVAGAQSKLISDYRESADSQQRQANSLLITAAGKLYGDALTAYQVCAEVDSNKKIAGKKALLDYNIKRYISEKSNAENKISAEAVALFGGPLPVVTECPVKVDL